MTNPYLIGKLPEENPYDNSTPELCHRIEKAEAPTPQDSNGAEEARAESRRKLIRERCGVDDADEGIQDEPEGPEEGNERDDNRVEKSLL